MIQRRLDRDGVKYDEQKRVLQHSSLITLLWRFVRLQLEMFLHREGSNFTLGWFTAAFSLSSCVWEPLSWCQTERCMSGVWLQTAVFPELQTPPEPEARQSSCAHGPEAHRPEHVMDSQNTTSASGECYEDEHTSDVWIRNDETSLWTIYLHKWIH